MADRTVLVTGGTGGLGSAVVDRFAEQGWRVVVPDVSPGGSAREGVELVTADLTDPDDVARTVRAAVGAGEAPLRAVAHLIGGYAGDQPVVDTPLGDFELQFERNVRPAYLVCQAVLPRLAAAGGGAICCVSTRAALHPFAGAAGYCASKAALIALARVVAREGAGDGVRCNVVLPSQIGTRAMLASTPPERHHTLVPPAEIARVIAFLCGEESAPTNGAAVPVYGRGMPD
jgi:NAD(P)-dependent dehydrogenase (short-subunit alcohol dehydrogenase family)